MFDPYWTLISAKHTCWMILVLCHCRLTPRRTPSQVGHRISTHLHQPCSAKQSNYRLNSKLSLLQGHIGRFVVNQPMVIGHESAGTVVEIGEGVQHLQVTIARP